MIKNNYPGKFVVIEGLDGSGQGTQIGRLVDFLNERTFALDIIIPVYV